MLTHLDELRVRIMRSLSAFVVAFISCFCFSNTLYTIISQPLIAKLKPGTILIATQVTAPFMVPLQLSFICALLLTAPYIIYQVWMFMRPALYKHERATIAPLIFISSILFYSGILFGSLVISPIALKFFTNCGPENITIMLDIGNYLDFIVTTAIATGIAFQIPIVTSVLVRMQIFTKQQLISKRKHIIILALIIGMILAPPDFVSHLLLSIPMWLLFELGLLFTPRTNKSNAIIFSKAGNLQI